MASTDPTLLSADRLVTLAKSIAPRATLFTSPSQVVVLLVHAIHTSLSFRLTTPTPTGDGAENALPDDWQQSSSFRYKHDQSSLEFVVSVLDLGDKLMIVGNAVDSSRSSSFEILKTDYLSPTSLSAAHPLPVSDLSPSKPFSTPTRLDDLIHLYRLNVLQKLVPGLRKEGYTELSSSSDSVRSTGAGPSSGTRPLAGTRDYLPDRGGPLGMYPERGRVPQPIGDDPLRIPGSGGRGGSGGGFGIGGGRPIGEVGRNDLEPLGGMGGTIGGGLGGLPGAGGMFMGPDHPLFRERFEGANNNEAQRRWGGDGFLPPMGAPPGARFDPVGPENGPPGSSGPAFGLPQGTFGPGGARGGRGGGGTGPFGGRSVHPDIEQPGPSGRGGGSDYDAMFG
ncbi:hypothetical protein JCM11491_006137 [Sporobolomyces phaffii]